MENPDERCICGNGGENECEETKSSTLLVVAANNPHLSEEQLDLLWMVGQLQFDSTWEPGDMCNFCGRVGERWVDYVIAMGESECIFCGSMEKND